MVTTKTSRKQSMNGLVRERLAEINLKISYGVRVAAIHSEYAREGMGGNLWSFRQAITRARKRVRLGAIATGVGPQQQVHRNGGGLAATSQGATKEASAGVASTVQSEEQKSGSPATGDHLDKYFRRESIISKKG
jgi:hypothetical protein